MPSGYLVTGSKIDALIESLTQLSSSIELLIIAEHIIPAIMLLYTTIDTMGYLYAPASIKYSNRKYFIEWTEKYLKPHMNQASFTGLDIYAARCGLVHSLSTDSKLFREGKVEQILYAWGDHKPEVIERVLSEIGLKTIVLHANELSSALRAAIQDFFTEIVKDNGRLESFINKTSMMLKGVSIPKEIRDQIENE